MCTASVQPGETYLHTCHRLTCCTWPHNTHMQREKETKMERERKARIREKQTDLHTQRKSSCSPCKANNCTWLGKDGSLGWVPYPQKHGGTQDSGDWVGNALARDIRCRSMNWLVQPPSGFCTIAKSTESGVSTARNPTTNMPVYVRMQGGWMDRLYTPHTASAARQAAHIHTRH